MKISILALIIFFSSPLLAQESNPFEKAITNTISPSPTLDSTVTTAVENEAIPTKVPQATTTPRSPTMIELSIEMADANAKIKPTISNKLFLTTLLDSFINQSCISDRPSTPLSNKSELCEAAIEKVKALDPSSPALVCVEKGLGSQDCSLAYSEQRSGVYEDEYQYKSAELDERFRIIDESHFAQLFQELSTGSETVRDSAAAKMLNLACKGVLVGPILDSSGAVVTVIDQPTEVPEENKVSEAEALIMDEILNKLSDTTPTSAPQNISFKRIRLINSQCKRAIETIARELPNSAKGTCLLRGYFTPSCIEAEASELRSKAPTPTPQKNGTPGAPAKKSGFETF